jgi:phosphoribosyl 1,2-cyclic phosphodiesterase/ActR/RegA family two-component response regulator
MEKNLASYNVMNDGKKYHFFIIDDDDKTIELYTRLLKERGHQISSSTSGREGLKKIFEVQPDCILCDLTMPDLDGVDLLNCVRLKSDIKQPKFIIITGKIFDFDRRRAFKHGVDGYLTKPIHSETFVKEILDILDTNIVVGFFGVRGTLPVPGPKSLRYGGNTNCVTLRIANKHLLIFDAGTGIKALSDTLICENNFPLKAKIFITHPHYDHINGIPFFVPLYMKGNHFDIYGARHGELGIEALLNNQMENVYFPVTMKEFIAEKNFHDITEESFEIEDLHIQTIFLNHPGRCIGYRIDYLKKSFCYITDNEFYLENSPHFLQHEVDRLINFIKDADLALIDTTYSDEEYLKKVGWGHSCVSRVVDIADKAHVKILGLYHHDLYQYDDDIDLKLKLAQALLEKRHSKTKCIAPTEGSTLIL